MVKKVIKLFTCSTASFILIFMMFVLTTSDISAGNNPDLLVYNITANGRVQLKCYNGEPYIKKEFLATSGYDSLIQAAFMIPFANGFPDTNAILQINYRLYSFDAQNFFNHFNPLPSWGWTGSDTTSNYIFDRNNLVIYFPGDTLITGNSESLFRNYYVVHTGDTDVITGLEKGVAGKSGDQETFEKSSLEVYLIERQRISGIRYTAFDNGIPFKQNRTTFIYTRSGKLKEIKEYQCGLPTPDSLISKTTFVYRNDLLIEVTQVNYKDTSTITDALDYDLSARLTGIYRRSAAPDTEMKLIIQFIYSVADGKLLEKREQRTTTFLSGETAPSESEIWYNYSYDEQTGLMLEITMTTQPGSFLEENRTIKSFRYLMR